ncbi:hypothetical protein DFH08DRAFT_1005493 [Mycena albidolilacea]|uniref:PUM-HD domain-containing protein n=1 Tax=Mycena albidolilacea TaxID=1033008 RepID=A0AAD7ASL7_9AGAR|nr:hypothetical protein DFH08DRAFT_1005493 [Mycena albidolilacea]
MASAPMNETTMFKNRYKFGLVGVYDQSLQTLGGPNTPMSVLVRLISETAFTKLLKRMPMALVAGFDAWRRKVSEQGTAAAKTPSPAPISFTSSTGSSSSSSAAAAPMSNGYSSVNGANGVNGAAPMVNGFSSSSSSSGSTSMTNGFAGSASTSSSSSDMQLQLWTPRSRADYQPHTTAARDDVPASTELFTRSEHWAFAVPSRDHSKHRESGADSVEGGPVGGGPVVVCPWDSRELCILPASVDERHLLLLLLLTHHLPLLHAHARVRVRLALPPLPQPHRALPTRRDRLSPLASINPTLSRRRSDYVNQSAEALSSLHQGRPLPLPLPAIDYLSARHILRPPPAVASSALERQDQPRGTGLFISGGPGIGVGGSGSGGGPPRIPSDYAPTYWSVIEVGTSGLKNLGDTCYMNAPIQCLSATLPFAQFFASELVPSFPALWALEERETVCHLNSQYNGSNQHGSQKFLSFLLDGIHEDLPARTNSGASDGKMNGLHGPKHKRGDMDRQFNRFAGTCLEDLQGKIPALCKEQHGCRNMIFRETFGHFADLIMTDPFGNYLCQKLLKYSTDEQRNVICDSKMIDFLSTRREADARYNAQIHSIIVALSLHVMVLIKDLNGNHVIQKCLNKLAPEDNQACFIIYNAVAANCIEVATHRHGCCVLQRCIDHASDHQRILRYIKGRVTRSQSPWARCKRTSA